VRDIYQVLTLTFRDTTATDRLESAALDVPPPEKNAADPLNPADFRCQDWILAYVNHLIDIRFIDASARTNLQSAPSII
jgi:hypothetical protein